MYVIRNIGGPNIIVPWLPSILCNISTMYCMYSSSISYIFLETLGALMSSISEYYFLSIICCLQVLSIGDKVLLTLSYRCEIKLDIYWPGGCQTSFDICLIIRPIFYLCGPNKIFLSRYYTNEQNLMTSWLKINSTFFK